MRIYGVVGWKNAGKTGLMERLISEISGRGFTVSTLKHAHHSFDVDQPGRDSHRHRLAGATEVLLSSRNRWALMHENRDTDEAALKDLLKQVGAVDLVLVEGFKRDGHPKVEAHRAETGNPLIAPGDPSVRAVASDSPLPDMRIPVFDLDDTSAIADFILTEVGLMTGGQPEPELAPPSRLRNDCFALPPGVDWVPVDDALARLKAGLSTVAGVERLSLQKLNGRILAAEVSANRANPPAANSAVDGYGFAHASLGEGPQILPLLAGRAAAGAPFRDTVPAGSSIRILTGALLPVGVDTVVLQEDVTVKDGHIAFQPGIRAGSNTRRAGEDVEAGSVILPRGHCLRPQDCALMAATGCTEALVHKPLRVGILSTGDEIVAPGQVDAPDKTYDANRPMLQNLAAAWGYEAINLGHVDDDRAALRDALDLAAGRTDVILTSGGASAGDEDHVSAVLTEAGAMSIWRIAVKPGRPLALGFWKGVPVFGLPGNPVAALICALIFARPALSVMAGGNWLAPQGFKVPAAFEKNKKPGRREFLRARLSAEGHAEAFQSEGSGRISGLSWATGLVELGDEARDIRPGDPVRYIPYASFGI
jgi:molybdopterin molybdotransferase